MYSLLKDKERDIIQLMSLFFCGMYINVEYDIQTEQRANSVKLYLFLFTFS